MEQNREPNNPWEARRVNITRPTNLMQDIKRPSEPSPQPMYVPQEPNIRPVQEYSPAKPPRRKFYFLLFIVIGLLAVAGLTAYYFYSKNSEIVSEEGTQLSELDKTVLDINKIAVLPINDTPALISVTDPEQLRNDSFFDRSLPGDQMLLYPRIGFAVLYRPATNQIVNMMSFNPNIGNSTSTATSTTTQLR